MRGYEPYPTNPETGQPYTLSDYHITVGSIIQLVAYQNGAQGVEAPDPSSADKNFTTYGTSFLPDTTPPGHQIVGTGTVTNFGNGVYGMVTWIDLPYPYDSLYVRVFSATEFALDNTTTSWWGISSVSNITDSGFGTALTWFDNTLTPNSNTFEVIPEPSSLSFLLSGGCGMGVFARYRRRRLLRPPEERP